MDWGLVPLTNGIQLPWTTPPIISGFLVSGWQGSILQALLLVLGMFIYYPFIRVMDDQYLREEWKAQEEESEEIDFDSLTSMIYKKGGNRREKNPFSLKPQFSRIWQ